MRVDRLLDLLPELRDLGRAGELLADFLGHLAELGVDAAIELLKPFTGFISDEIPRTSESSFRSSSRSTPTSPDPRRASRSDFRTTPGRVCRWTTKPMTRFCRPSSPRSGFRCRELSMSCSCCTRTSPSPTSLHEAAYRRTGLYAHLGALCREGDAPVDGRFTLVRGRLNGRTRRAQDRSRTGSRETRGDPALTFFPQLWQLLRDYHVP